ncbi:hypothetical protein WJX73_001850 [Symbiochloris irregularis]|uniref:SET domain-containing protein n=1 Tax=Symbiochloris irregularis TaxID=706552 RepID=A0AAW1P092_9CHLO
MVCQHWPTSLKRGREVQLQAVEEGTALAYGSAADIPNIRPAAAFALILSGIAAALLNGLGGLRAQVINGALYVQWGEEISTDGPSLAPGAVEVRVTGDTRGNGAFATQLIKKDTFLGPYEGELLDEAQYWDRYPSGMSDYAICIDAEMTLDACERVKDTSVFSPCHINHSSTRNNVARQPLREQQAIHFFAKRDIQIGEELLLDYGRMYWKGREDKELD